MRETRKLWKTFLWSKKSYQLLKGYSLRETVETLKRFWIEIEERIFGDFLAYNPKEIDESYLEEAIMRIARLIV